MFSYIIITLLVIALSVATVAWLLSRREATYFADEVLELHADNEWLREKYRELELSAAKESGEYAIERAEMVHLLGKDHREMKEYHRRIENLEADVSILRWSAEMSKPVFLDDKQAKAARLPKLK